MKVIGLTGPARSGKNTVASFMQHECRSRRLWCDVQSFASPIYDMIQALLGARNIDFPYGRNEGDAPRGGYKPKYRDKEEVLKGVGVSIRTMAQTLGTEWGRDLINPSIWISHLDQRITRAERTGIVDLFVVTDVRFEDEASLIRSKGRLLHIGRPNLPLIGGVPGHPSEAMVAMQANEGKIVNCGPLESLRADALYWMNEYLGQDTDE